MKKHWTILMLPALLLTLAACGVEHPTLEDGTGVSVTLGEAVRLDTPDQLTVYQLAVDVDQAKADIERAFGITLGTALSNGAYVGEDYSVTLDSRTGHWTYQATKDPAPAVPPEEAISDQQAIDLATQFMTEKQLWNGEFSDGIATDATSGGGNTPELVEEKIVCFYPMVDQKTVTGTFRWILRLDPQGNLTEVDNYTAPIGEAVTVEGKSRADLVQAAANGEGSVSGDVSDGTEIKFAETAYYADPEGDCLYPVYLLRGDRFDVLIDGRK